MTVKFTFSSTTPVAIVGVGLIGGSIAKALRARGHTGSILGIGRNLERLKLAVRDGLIDDAANDFSQVGDYDVIVFCGPVDVIPQQIGQAVPHLSAGTLLTDAGSTKQVICERVRQYEEELVRKGSVFLGAHPLAGSEKTGFEFARAELFVDRLCVLSPEQSTPPTALESLTRFWTALGMRVATLDPRTHDRLLAEASHLPHLLASALAGVLSDDAAPFAATGFRDTTRIASGEVGVWTDIFLHNADAVLDALSTLTGQLDRFSEALRNRDRERLQSLLTEGKLRRDGLNE